MVVGPFPGVVLLNVLLRGLGRTFTVVSCLLGGGCVRLDQCCATIGPTCRRWADPVAASQRSGVSRAGVSGCGM